MPSNAQTNTTPSNQLPDDVFVDTIKGNMSIKDFAILLEDTVREIARTSRKKEDKQQEPKEKVVLFKEGKASVLKGDTFSKVFGWEGYGPDFKVSMFDQLDWPLELRPMIPKMSAFKDYIPQKDEIYDLVLGIESGDKINIVGPKGTGKSSVVEYVCAVLQRPFFRFNGRGDMESSSIMGQLTVRNTKGVPETIWQDGIFTQMVRNGVVTVFDEYSATPPDITMSLQWLLEENGKLLLTDMPTDSAERLVEPHKHFRLICTDNTHGFGDMSGKYSGTNVQNEAIIDRFQTTINLNYLGASHDVEIIKAKYPELTEELATRMVMLAAKTRDGEQEGLTFSMSIRSLLSWSKKALHFKDVRKAFNLAYYNKLPSDEDRATVDGLYELVFADTAEEDFISDQVESDDDDIPF